MEKVDEIRCGDWTALQPTIVLPRKEWNRLDVLVRKVVTARTPITNRLVELGLVKHLPSDVAALTPSVGQVGTTSLPLPITHHQIKDIKRNEWVEASARRVGEQIEQLTDDVCVVA